MTDVRHLRFDVAQRPFLVLFELTRACDFACRHCRAESIPTPDPDDLRTDEVVRVLDDLSALGSPRPHVVFTGGDPLHRADLDDLVRHAAEGGLAVGVAPAGTERATAARFAALRAAGASAVSLSIDGATASAHDAFRRVGGSFDSTLAACEAARGAGLRLQVNTTVCHETVDELPPITRLVARLGASLWSVFFLIPVGRGRDLHALTADETEDVLEFCYAASELIPLKTTEAPSFRRVLAQHRSGSRTRPPGPLALRLQERLDALWATADASPGATSAGMLHETDRRGSPRTRSAPSQRTGTRRRRPPLAVGDGRGVVFVSHRGDVQPSGFLPLVAGNVRDTPLTQIYATAPVLSSLRDATRLGGRCGRCELRDACGGSRAQAFARLGDPLEADPTCSYEPGAA